MSTVRIQVRRGLASEWTAANPVLAAGEMGVETDTNKFKFGNGTDTWTALSYAAADTAAIGEISQDAINQALSVGAGLTKTYDDGANTITVIVDTDIVSTKAFATAEANAAQAAAEATAEAYTDSAVSGVNNSLVDYLPVADRAVANGVASLDGSGNVPESELGLGTLSSNIITSGYVQASDLTLSGNLYVNGTTVTLDTATFSTEDPMIQLGKDNISNMVDLGFVAAHDDGTGQNHTGLVRDASASKWKLFKGVTTQPGATVDFTEATFDDLQMRNLEAANVSMANLDVSGTVNIPADTITGSNIIDGAVLTAKIADLAVTEGKIGALAVTDQKIAANAVINAKIADGAVSSSKIANETIVDGNISQTAEIAQSKIAGLGTTLNLLAPKEGPTFTGTVVLPATTSIGNLSSTEIGYLEGITSSAQTQITAAGTALNDHSANTTNVHGIADTAQLATLAGAETLTNKTLVSPTITVPGANTQLISDQALYQFTGVNTISLTYPGDNRWGTSGYTAPSSGTVQIAGGAPGANGTYTITNLVSQTEDTTTFTVSETLTPGSGNPATAVTVTGAGASLTVSATELGYLDGVTSNIQTQLSNTVTAIATAKSEAIAEVTAVIDSAPEALNTLNELAAALGDDENFAATVTTNLALKVDSLTPITQKSESYTLSTLDHRDDLIEMGSSSALTLTIPLNSSIAYPVGTSLDILQTGAGQVTIAGDSGVTVNATPGLKLRTQWSSATLLKRAEDTWVVYGDLTA
jgi:hypothetical protein